MSAIRHPLDRLQIASPCPASWEDMHGDDRVRRCDLCNLNVYNLAALTQQQAEGLIAERAGGLCVRIFRRKDGTVLTRDCPVGLRRARMRFAGLLTACAAGLLLVAEFVGLLKPSAGPQERSLRARRIQPVKAAADWLDPPPSAISAKTLAELQSMGYVSAFGCDAAPEEQADPTDERPDDGRG